eukprot:18085-Heterococcus_DN1.PRE.1
MFKVSRCGALRCTSQSLLLRSLSNAAAQLACALIQLTFTTATIATIPTIAATTMQQLLQQHWRPRQQQRQAQQHQQATASS